MGVEGGCGGWGGLAFMSLHFRQADSMARILKFSILGIPTW